MREAIKKRVSRRTFTQEVLNEKEMRIIQSKLDEINEQAALNFSFLFEGAKAFENRSKSYGMFKNVKSLILLKGQKGDVNLLEKIGYYGEQLVLDLTDMGIGSCWVAGTFDRERIAIPDKEQLCCVLPVGHIDKITMKERVLRGAISKRRKPLEERLTGAEDAPQWVKDAMEAVRLAPSAVNSQNPVFHYENGVVTASVEDKSLTDLIDLGIAKKHFEETAGGVFAIGNGAVFVKKTADS